MLLDVERIATLLGLVPLPGEGGHFRETYRASMVDPRKRPARRLRRPARGEHRLYYLLSPDAFSALHRLPGDEVYHFYLGDPVELLHLRPGGAGKVTVLTRDEPVAPVGRPEYPWAAFPSE